MHIFKCWLTSVSKKSMPPSGKNYVQRQTGQKQYTPPPPTLFVGDIKINSSIEHLCNHNPQITFVFHAYFYLFAKYLKFPVEFHIVTSSGQNREILLLSSRFAFLIRLGFTARSCWRWQTLPAISFYNWFVRAWRPWTDKQKEK